jgi:hypothetical protein
MSRRTDPTRPWGGRPPDPSLRVGDAERNEAADALSQHFSAGRLDQNELKERLDRAMSAKTGSDLSRLLTDLPSLGPEPAVPPVPRRRRAAGAWLLLAVVFLAFFAFPWHFVQWMWLPHVPFILFGVLAFLLWRRARRGRWRGETVS